MSSGSLAGAKARGRGPFYERVLRLYPVFAPDATRLAYLLTGDMGVAEDIVQEAFTRLLGRFGDRKPPDSINAYLRKTVINLCRSYARRRGLEPRTVERYQADAPRSQDLDGVDDRERLWRLLLNLPVRQRAVIYLRYYADLPVATTADLLGCSPSAVKSLLMRAVKALRQSMEVDFQDG